jgi:hypothetical protein
MCSAMWPFRWKEHSSAPQSSQVAVSGKKRRNHPLSALRRRDFRLFWIGQTISSAGNATQAVALTWMILSMRGSTVDLALALFALTVPQAVFTLAGGILTDRQDARSVMILADGMRILTSGTLALLARSVGEHLWLVWGILLFHGTANALFTPAANTIAPRLVEVEDVESANALSSAMSQVGPLLGYLPAGLLVAAFGPAPAFALNALSYAVAVFTALLMRPLERVSRDKRRVVWHEIREAVHYVRTTPWLLAMLFMDVLVAWAAITTNSIGAPLLAKALHAGALGYSLLAWSYSTGAVLGLLLPALYPLRSHRGVICIACQGTEAILMLLIAFVPLPLGALCMLSWSALNGILIVMTVTLLQQRTPATMIGRVMAFWTLASTGVQPIAQMMGGSIANALGVQALFALAGGVVLLGAVLGGSFQALRQLN